MGWKKLSFLSGVALGAMIGYTVAISLTEEERERLKQVLQEQGKDVVTLLKERGTEYVRDWGDTFVERVDF
ncbi:MAG: hypothetical protein GXO55_11215 [Chloroflexi bacterium]|nr:hypothetical protein [Chloroflexota bacterium]